MSYLDLVANALNFSISTFSSLFGSYVRKYIRVIFAKCDFVFDKFNYI